MGRPRIPTAIHEISGAFAKNPSRKRARLGEIKITTVLGDAPQKWLEGAERGSPENTELVEIWKEISTDAPPGVLNRSHRIFVEMICYLTYRIRHRVAKSGEFGKLESLLGKVRMRPGDMVGVSDGKPPARGGSRWGELVG